MAGWRPLGVFWAAVLLVVAGLGVTLQMMGPPGAKPAADAGHGRVGAQPAHGHAPSAQVPVAQAPHSGSDHAAAPSPTPPPPDTKRVAGPDPALLERSSNPSGAQLPRIAADGRVARVVYAAPGVAAGGRPRIALLISSFGQSEKDSRAVLEALPGPVSLAVSAYAVGPGSLYDAARAGGHELLASIPMEPQGYPLNDAGTRSLLTGLSADDNRLNLEWALGRMPGAVGATSASDGMRGERFAEVTGAFDPVLDEIARRGLLFIDARPGRSVQRPGLAARGVDVVLDESPARAEIEARLVTLERIAREKGTAVGLAGAARPVTLERLAAWVQTMEGRGLVLVPVSSLVGSPEGVGKEGAR